MTSASQQCVRRLLGRLGGCVARNAESRLSSTPSSPCGLLASRLLSNAAATPSVARAGVEGAASGFSLSRLLNDYKMLSKLKLSSLVVLTAGAGFAAASGEEIDYAKLAWTSLGTLGAAACANTLNQIYEVSNDRLMSRTRNRPLPTGRLGRVHAGAFALVCGAAGLWLLHEKANPLTAGLGAANILLYAAVYTPLKQLTVANTWVGAVVGAIPPLMGWASAAGQLDAGAAVLAAALFFWQMPHFMALAWLCKADYAAGGFRMLSMLDATGRRTALVGLRHSLYIAPVGLLAVLAGFATEPFAWESAALAAYLAYGSVQFARHPSQAAARKLFKASLLYLPLLLAALAVHRVPNQHDVDWETLGARVLACVPVAVRLQLGRACGAVEDAAAQLGDTLLANNIKCPSKAAADSEEQHPEPPPALPPTQQQVAKRK
ncbi:Protoheme IX farnesyltransferase, mitochondrial [Tetrabaena socialis]|uniref:Heme O synthase n=1 Tax=Tetrabaena socialis TaxID=47790 RepID=A0A2J8A8R1_9CHLO|nr:Protoheme IX farnesyltransferase, mitochondrial [Tetrabaena socialis]|eukprot:PNH08926.1 Protoheme IX farnesyltransferase, mitochondrial [Tetrabaena socialis]